MTDHYQDILVGLAIVAAVAGVFIVLPLSIRSGLRAAERDYDNWTGTDQAQRRGYPLPPYRGLNATQRRRY
jgi:hypothetical protein